MTFKRIYLHPIIKWIMVYFNKVKEIDGQSLEHPKDLSFLNKIWEDKYLVKTHWVALLTIRG